VHNTKLTQREVSHFITATITTEEDGSKEEEEMGLEEWIEDTASPGGSPLQPERCAESGFGPSDQPSTVKKGPEELARRPFNPHSMPSVVA
jgi:hypothetical protein